MCICSLAKMPLFLTRACFFRFSIELRLGESGRLGSSLKLFSEFSKRSRGELVCSFQNRRGLFWKGEEPPKGDCPLLVYMRWGWLAGSRKEVGGTTGAKLSA